MPIDYTFRIQSPHLPGSLARAMGAIGRAEGLIGDVKTITLGQDASIREVTVECRDATHADEVAGAIAETEGMRVFWYRDRALIRHEGGKLDIKPSVRVETVQDVRDIYTPGVARACTAIVADPAQAAQLTMIGRSVAICTNGTRVLGLGDIGPLASMPVMEGKAVFYRQFAGISAMPILINAKDVDGFVATVAQIATTFGGIHLEDISAPECFEIERRLIDLLPQPVMHDDVHGTAVVTLAAALVAARSAGLELERATVGQIGLGAAGYGIAALMLDGGAKRVLASDPNPMSHERALAKGIELVDMPTVMEEADLVVATTGRPGLISPDMVRRGQVILALTNPYPEIDPAEALKAGAAFAADGRSVNNVLGYPGIFRGALLAGADVINLEMKLAAAHAIAGLAAEAVLVPDVLVRRVHDTVAQAVRDAAVATGVSHPERTPPNL